MIRRFIFLYFCCVLASLAYAADTPKIFTKDNVLAAGCYNDGFSSSDMTLIIQLTVGKDVVFDEGFEVKYHVPDKDVEGWTELEFDDKNWKKGITSIGYGDGDDNTPNKDRWKKPVTPRERDVHETIHEFEIDVKFGGGSGLSVEAANRLTTTWGRLKNHLD
ncbi:hypothetical protein C6500_10060 [Candidatus Poribacteria bacterium]|nr:MAG: hypothetical protein C6500_10060 [Candidatus Poribacteria bacterium]